LVDRDDVHALARERVEVGGQRRDQRLALARAHLRDLALVKRYAADELDIEVAHLQRAPCRLAHDGEGLWQQVIDRLALPQAAAEFLRLAAQGFVAQGLEPGLELLRCADVPPITAEQPVIAAAENVLQS